MHYFYLKSRFLGSSLTITPFSGRVLNFLPFCLLIVGSFLLASATVPILAYQLFMSPQFTPLVKPVPDDSLAFQTTANSQVLGDQTEVDMTQPANWFPSVPYLPPHPSKITAYNISIPHLKIQRAKVSLDNTDLKKSLIHYPGTALPGQFGNAVIFGHSTLPQLFNTNNYLTIFSTLPKLTKGDEILVDFDGISYKYLVIDMVEVKPDDISVLEQRYDDSYLTLVTCVPPGTYLRRLVIRARLQEV